MSEERERAREEKTRAMMKGKKIPFECKGLALGVLNTSSRVRVVYIAN